MRDIILKILEKTNLFCFVYKYKSSSISVYELIPKRLIEHYDLEFIKVNFCLLARQQFTISPNHNRIKRFMVRNCKVKIMQDGIVDTANEIFRNSVTLSNKVTKSDIQFYSEDCEIEYSMIKKYAQTRINLNKTKIRIGLCTANTPYFNEKEKERLVNILAELRKYDKTSRVEIDYRISPKLESLGVNNRSIDLKEYLKNVDLVISTKSTVLEQSLSSGIPVIEIRHRAVGMTRSLLQISNPEDVKYVFDRIVSLNKEMSGLELINCLCDYDT